jgi:hypothetical protein
VTCIAKRTGYFEVWERASVVQTGRNVIVMEDRETPGLENPRIIC